MSHTFRPGRALMALLLAALALWPLAALGSRCATCPQPRAVASCCQMSAHAFGEGSEAWVSGCCDKAAPSAAAQPAREAKLTPGAPAAVVLPTDEAPVPVLEIVSSRLPVRLDPRRAIPLYTLFSALLI